MITIILAFIIGFIMGAIAMAFVDDNEPTNKDDDYIYYLDSDFSEVETDYANGRDYKKHTKRRHKRFKGE